MTDEQILRHYEHQARYEAKRVERYRTDPEFRKRRLQQSLEAQKRRRKRLREMRQG